MSFFGVLGSIFEKWPMTDLTNVIVSMCLVSYNFFMIPHELTVTFGLNLSGAWGVQDKIFLYPLKECDNKIGNALDLLFFTDY